MFYTKVVLPFIYLIIIFLHIIFCSKINAQCNTIYVSTSGNDANPGTASLPIASLTTAFNLISNNRTNIKVAVGVYTENTVLNLSDNVHIDGGYSVIGNVWTKASNASSTIILSGEETVGNAQNRIGFKADGISNWSLRDLTITTTNIVGADLLGRGKSNYAIWVYNASNYDILRCNITSGNAGDGAVGAVGANGANGDNGTKGGSGSCDGNYTCCFGSESAPGGVGGAGGAGGGGTAAGASNSSTTANLNPGTDGLGRNGGGGGAGGKGGGFNIPSANYAAINGSNGGGTASLGQNTGVGIAGAIGSPGGDGSDGANGLAGSNGGLGNAGGAGIHSGGFFMPTQAGSGTDGTGGQGGAGAGGGGREVCATCDSGPGNGGAGGGGGGQGGAGGAGGWGGGGSFGIYITNSNVGATILQNTITTGLAGNGNIGGLGGQGGLGGLGGERDTTCTSQIGEGGSGGFGGIGGNGGQGGTASNGIVAQICIDGILSNSTPTLPTNLITAAYSGCTNSEIVLTKTNGNWSDLNGGIFVNNLTDSTSSYHIDSNTIVLFYDSLGLKSLMNDTVVFYHFLNIHSSRPLPSFNSNMPNIICEGDSLRMSSPEIGEEYEWVVFADNNTTASPLATYNTSIAFFQAPITGISTFYNIRLRIKNACCGWSIPVYFHFETIPSFASPSVTLDTVCAGDTAVLTTTGIYTLNWFSDALGQNILTTGATPNLVLNTPILNQNTTFYASQSIGGCHSNLVPAEVEVYEAPTANTIQICENQNIILNAIGSGMGDLVFYDSAMTELSRITMSLAVPNASLNLGILPAGFYNYYVKEEGGICTNLITSIPVNVYAPQNNFAIFLNGDTLISPYPQSNYWYFNNSSTPIDSTISLICSQSGTYYATGLDVNGCFATSDTLNVNCAIGITKIEENFTLQVYPNPTSGVFYLSSSKIPNENYILNIQDLLGQVLFTKNLQITNNQFQQEYSITDLPNGIYFLNIEIGKTKAMIKICKQY